jgi:hypothetical protein
VQLHPAAPGDRDRPSQNVGEVEHQLTLTEPDGAHGDGDEIDPADGRDRGAETGEHDPALLVAQRDLITDTEPAPHPDRQADHDQHERTGDNRTPPWPRLVEIAPAPPRVRRAGGLGTPVAGRAVSLTDCCERLVSTADMST